MATSTLMHKVFEAITDLEPLSSTAMPHTQKHFQKTTDCFQQYSNLIQCHLVGICEASGIETKFEWDEPKGPETCTKSKIVISLLFFLFFFSHFFQ